MSVIDEFRRLLGLPPQEDPLPPPVDPRASTYDTDWYNPNLSLDEDASGIQWPHADAAAATQRTDQSFRAGERSSPNVSLPPEIDQVNQAMRDRVQLSRGPASAPAAPVDLPPELLAQLMQMRGTNQRINEDHNYRPSKGGKVSSDTKSAMLRRLGTPSNPRRVN